MTVKWKDEALRLFNDGATYVEIGKAVDRSPTRVYRVLNPKEYPAYEKKRHEDSEETKKRRLLRRWCRRCAEREGRPVEEVYAANGVQDFDKVELWDRRKA